MSNDYPTVGFHFKAKFQGLSINSEIIFTEVSSLVMDNIEEKQKEGSAKFQNQIPGTPKYNNVVLKRGLLKDEAIRKWIEASLNEFNLSPITVSIELIDHQEKVLKTWTLQNAYPVKWKISSFDTQENETPVESLELAFDSLASKN